MKTEAVQNLRDHARKRCDAFNSRRPRGMTRANYIIAQRFEETEEQRNARYARLQRHLTLEQFLEVLDFEARAYGTASVKEESR